MKRFLLPFIAFAVASCSSVSTDQARCTAKLQDQLKDPQSLQVMSFEQMHNDERKAVYRVDYNAKNSFGGYVGRRSFVCRLPKTHS